MKSFNESEKASVYNRLYEQLFYPHLTDKDRALLRLWISRFKDNPQMDISTRSVADAQPVDIEENFKRIFDFVSPPNGTSFTSDVPKAAMEAWVSRLERELQEDMRTAAAFENFQDQMHQRRYADDQDRTVSDRNGVDIADLKRNIRQTAKDISKADPASDEERKNQLKQKVAVVEANLETLEQSVAEENIYSLRLWSARLAIANGALVAFIGNAIMGGKLATTAGAAPFILSLIGLFCAGIIPRAVYTFNRKTLESLKELVELADRSLHDNDAAKLMAIENSSTFLATERASSAPERLRFSALFMFLAAIATTIFVVILQPKVGNDLASQSAQPIPQTRPVPPSEQSPPSPEAALSPPLETTANQAPVPADETETSSSETRDEFTPASPAEK